VSALDAGISLTGIVVAEQGPEAACMMVAGTHAIDRGEATAARMLISPMTRAGGTSV
jgi:hypothetical protein